MQILDWILHLDKAMAQVIAQHGVWIYALLIAIVFAETGLIVLPFLPGDTLLFAAGAYVATGELNALILVSTLVLAAGIGNTVNYAAGRWVYQQYGEAIFSGRLRWLDEKALRKTQGFYDKYGAFTVIAARFIPVVRTFAPFVAGIAKMQPAKFQLYTWAGSLLWVGGLVLAGYLFGNLPWVKQHLNLIILGGLLAAVIPALGGVLYKLLQKK